MARQKRTTEEPQETGTALALPDTPVLVAAFSDPEKMESILARIEQEVMSVVPDLSTAASRKAIASTAYKVARSKTALDEVGKTITEDARKQIDAVNAKRRDVRDRLETLQKQVRAPLDEWEAAEAARIADLEDRLKDFSEDLPGLDAPSAEIEKVIKEIAAIPVDGTWQEFEGRAAAAKTGTLNVLHDLLAKAKVREAERAELERLRAEAAEREAAEQRRLAAERAKAEAVRIEREKIEAAERAAQAERDRAKREAAEAEERHAREVAAAAQREADEKAKAARQAAETEARHQREMAEAKAREEAAAARERERIAAEQARADAERRAREADQARRAQVDLAIREALVEAAEVFAPSNPSDPDLHWEDALGHAVDAIMAGRIPHVKVEM